MLCLGDGALASKDILRLCWKGVDGVEFDWRMATLERVPVAKCWTRLFPKSPSVVIMNDKSLSVARLVLRNDEMQSH